jgi:hypothetical protein
MGPYLGALFIVLVAIAIVFERRRLAEAQALVLGGSVLPGCVIAEAIALVVIACAIAAAHWLRLV